MQNIEKLKKALFYIYDDDSINEINVNELKDYAVIRYGTPDNFNIDLITHIGKLFIFTDLEYKIETVENHKIKLATLETLLKLKSNSLREIDLSDARFLSKLIEKRRNASL